MKLLFIAEGNATTECHQEIFAKTSNKEDEIIEGKKGRTYSTTAKKEDQPMVIKPQKASIGHQSHGSGSGAHGDKRQKRQKTRADKNRTWKREQVY